MDSNSSSNSSNVVPTMVSIGQKLKEAREKKSVTLDQVQKQTRMHSTVLQALEEGRCDDILTPTYVKAFLKHYAAYLGLDSREILKEYSVVRPDSTGKVVSANKADTANAIDLSNLFYATKIVVSLLIAFVLIAFLGGKTINFIKKIRVNTPAKIAEKKEASSALKSAILVKKKQSRKAVSAPVPKEKDAPKEKTVPSVSTQIPKNEPLSLVLKTKQSVLVQLKKDGVTLFKSVLPRGTVESIKADNSINIYIAKAEAVEITLNGKPVDIPGKGVIKDLEITRKGIKVK